jgi:hypothetical protein
VYEVGQLDELPTGQWQYGPSRVVLRNLGYYPQARRLATGESSKAPLARTVGHCAMRETTEYDTPSEMTERRFQLARLLSHNFDITPYGPSMPTSTRLCLAVHGSVLTIPEPEPTTVDCQHVAMVVPTSNQQPATSNQQCYSVPCQSAGLMNVTYSTEGKCSLL